MLINRRTFLGGTRVLGIALARGATDDRKAQSVSTTRWRTFRVTTQVEVLKPAGTTRIWLPIALSQNNPFQKSLSNTLRYDTGTARILRSAHGLDLVLAEFPAGAKPSLSVISAVKTRDWVVDVAADHRRHVHSSSGMSADLKPTKMLPTDGIVKVRAQQITNTASTDLDKARAIYEWIVENTYRNPRTRGCGMGDVRFMLESGDLGGKCADLNALYVALARAAGLPARDVYGIRLASSQMGCKSLGVSSSDVTKAQHCRAEVFLNEYGWVPVDPADVRKVVLEEPPGNRSLGDERVERTRNRLFGSWEMNWMAYNYAQDVALPDSSGPPLHYFMYPQAETAEGRLDSLNPDQFRYRITSVEVNSVD
jgi:transglutaminase-like putative cysteine protease